MAAALGGSAGIAKFWAGLGRGRFGCSDAGRGEGGEGEPAKGAASQLQTCVPHPVPPCSLSLLRLMPAAHLVWAPSNL